MVYPLKLTIVLGLILVTISSCLVVAVETDSRQAEVRLDRAKEHIARLANNSSSGKPHRLVFLAYEPEENQLVKITLPLWLVKKGLEEKIGNSTRYRSKTIDYDFDTKALLQAITQLPRGLLVEVWSEEEKILLWLE